MDIGLIFFCFNQKKLHFALDAPYLISYVLLQNLPELFVMKISVDFVCFNRGRMIHYHKLE